MTHGLTTTATTCIVVNQHVMSHVLHHIDMFNELKISQEIA